jgi:hypothetical protein
VWSIRFTRHPVKERETVTQCDGVFTFTLRKGPSEMRRDQGFTGTDWAVLKAWVINIVTLSWVSTKPRPAHSDAILFDPTMVFS